MLQVIQRERPFGMTRQLNALPGSEVRENQLPRLFQLLLELFDFLLKADPQSFRMFPQLIELGLNFKNRLLKIEQIFHIELTLVFLRPSRNVEFCTIKEPDCSGSVMMRLIRPHRGAQKGSEANYFGAVRAPLLA